MVQRVSLIKIINPNLRSQMQLVWPTGEVGWLGVISSDGKIAVLFLEFLGIETHNRSVYNHDPTSPQDPIYSL